MLKSTIRSGIRDRVRDGALRSRLAQGLVGAVPVVEHFVLAKSVPQVVFVPQEAAVEEFTATRPHPPLHDGIHARHPDAGEYGLDTHAGEASVHEGGELPIPVSDQKACSAACVFQVHHEVPDRLDHPVGGRVSSGAQYASAPAACSMTARMYRRCPFKVTVSMKSQASRAWAWERRKSAHVAVPARVAAHARPDPVTAGAPSPARLQRPQAGPGDAGRRPPVSAGIVRKAVASSRTSSCPLRVGFARREAHARRDCAGCR